MGILPSCKDPALHALKQHGYNVVRLPRVDLTPTQLLFGSGKKLQRLGGLDSLFVPSTAAPVPVILPDQPGPNIKGQKSAQLDVGIGLNILGGLISALGGSTLGITVGYAKARSVEFEFVDTIANSSELTRIDQFLSGAKINSLARAAADMLDEHEVYVVTATLKAKKINVTAKGSDKVDLKIDLPVVQQAVGANVKVGSTAAGGATVTYEGAVPLVFGFQAIQLIFDDGVYRTMRQVDAGDVVTEATAESGSDAPLYVDRAATLI